MTGIEVNGKRITLFIDELVTGGAQRVFILLSKELAKKGHDVDLVVLSDRGDLFRTVDQRVTLINLGTLSDGRITPMSGARTLIAFLQYLKHRSPDGILSTLTGGNLLSVIAWTLSGRKGRLVLSEASSLKNVSSKWRLFLMSVLYKRASYVVALTSAHAKQLESRLSVPDNRLRVIGNPVDPDIRIETDSRAADQLKENIGPYLLAVGRLTPAKDFASLIKAYALAAHQDDFPGLVIVGDGPERQSLERLVRDLGVADKVFLVGNQFALAPWYSNARAFVMTSLWEGYPIALLEALSFELPISVTTYDDSIVEIVEDLGAKSVSFSEPGNTRDIALSIERVIAMGKNTDVCLDAGKIVDTYEKLLVS